MGERRPLVLICEDEPALRELVRVSLGDSYRFREAGTVAESIDALGGSAPDLVVLDLMLVGGSGLEVLRTIRSDSGLSQTRVVVISALSDEANRAAVEQEGADAFVTKPFAPESLAGQVEELLQARVARNRVAPELDSAASPTVSASAPNPPRSSYFRSR